MATAELVVLRPVAVGAGATAFGCMIAAAPVPAGAAFAGYVAAALVVMVGWMRNRPGHRAFGVANALTLARLVAAVAVPALRAPLPFSQVRRVIGLGQAIILVLCVLLATVTSGSWLALLPAIALLSLVWSFGRDAWGQLVSARR
ncbi:hypothetical protein E0H73_29895 [Kribbella pittospori]|uniref:Uncharacterized protein n=1 Tax=Kribbella pittospori TaxID=722689 RepID=A0A4R0KEP5_9ACTN|nr:hypothetical protein [Kribbella pittospori]TCC57584.1 hypothetical protein E0H73_29895 [Kribbella pittospori]